MWCLETERVYHYGNGAEPKARPTRCNGVPENHIRALFEGLAVKNPKTLEPEPGVAERWEISDDGTVYTFFINPNASGVTVRPSQPLTMSGRGTVRCTPIRARFTLACCTPSLIQRPTQSENHRLQRGRGQSAR